MVTEAGNWRESRGGTATDRPSANEPSSDLEALNRVGDSGTAELDLRGEGVDAAGNMACVVVGLGTLAALGRSAWPICTTMSPLSLPRVLTVMWGASPWLCSFSGVVVANLVDVLVIVGDKVVGVTCSSSSSSGGWRHKLSGIGADSADANV